MLPLRTLLFVPANRDRMLQRALTSDADAIVVDLEDAVPSSEKAAARKSAARFIPRLAKAGQRVFVRVNGIQTGLTRDDLLAAVSGSLSAVVLPKTESPQDLRDLDVLLREAEMAHGVRPGDVATLPLIESALGVLRCEEILSGSDRVLGLSAGAEDYVYDLGVERSATALQHLRATIVQVCAAYSITPIDTPYPEHTDEAGLLEEAQLAKSIGMKGKYVIHPDQVGPVNAVFSPSKDDVARAKAIVAAYDVAAKKGRGAISVEGRMVDAPIAERARALIAADAAIRKRARARR